MNRYLACADVVCRPGSGGRGRGRTARSHRKDCAQQGRNTHGWHPGQTVLLTEFFTGA
jgi:hypothetical protein